MSRNPADPVIDGPDVEWGRALAQHCVDTLLREADRNVAETDFERDVLKALRIIREHGPVSPRDMWHRGFKHKDRDRNEVMQTLLDYDLVTVVQTQPGPGGGRPTARYIANAAAFARESAQAE